MGSGHMNGKIFLPAIMAAVLLAGLLSFSNYGGGQAEAPQWEKGDQWSMGYETDLGEIFSTMLGALEESEEEFGSIDQDIQGKAGYFMIFEISGATDTQYTMDISTGGGVEIDGNAKITSQMPEEGTYRYDYDDWDYEPPMVEKEVSIDLFLDVSLGVDGLAHFTKDDMKLQDLDLVFTFEGDFDLEMLNFPETDYDYDEETDEEIIIVEYNDYDISGSVDIKVTLSMEFDPPLDILNFPIEEDEEWVAESNMTVSGTYQGAIDVRGLPDLIAIAMMEEGISFPMILEDLDTGSDDLRDGVLEEQTVPISIPLTCSGTEMITLADGSSSEAYIIQFQEEEYYDEEYYPPDPYEYLPFDDDDEEYYPEEMEEEEESSGPDMSGMKFLYCPEEGFFVSAQMEGIGEEFGLDGSSGEGDPIQLTPMRSDDAEKKLGIFEGESGEDNEPGFFLWGLIAAVAIGALIIIVVVIAVMVMKRKHKS